MTIICATDFSPNSEAALAVAGAIVGRSGDDQVVIAHAFDLLDPVFEQLYFDQARDAVEFRLLQTTEGFCRTTGVRAQPALVYGAPAEAIAEIALVRRASLVVVSSQGHSAKPLRRLGGTSERIAQRLDVPLLVVRDATPFVAWSRAERPLKILLGIDRTGSWNASLAWVNRLRELGPCDVVVAQVYYSGEEREHYGLPRGHALGETDQEVEALLVRDMEARVVLRGTGAARFKPVLGVGRLGDHLVDMAKHEQVDLIALGTHRRSGLARLASVASVTLHYAPSSVLLVPPAPVADEVRPPRRVLIATDLSPFSGRMVAHGFSLVEGQQGGEVILLHVEVETDEATKVARQQALRQLVPMNRADRTRIVVLQGDNPAKLICTEAARSGADVVCLGSHGRSGVSRALLGSVAEEVIRASDRPVLIVRTAASD